MRGGSGGGAFSFQELFKRAAPMPASTKAKMDIDLLTECFLITYTQ
jgi:hypothetical protein